MIKLVFGQYLEVEVEDEISARAVEKALLLGAIELGYEVEERRYEGQYWAMVPTNRLGYARPDSEIAYDLIIGRAFANFAKRVYN